MKNQSLRKKAKKVVRGLIATLMAIVILALIIVFTGKIDFGNPTSKEDKVNEEKTKEDDPDDVETTMVESGDDYELEGIATLHFADDALEEEAEISL